MLMTDLRYYINDADQVRSIEFPDQEFNFFISKNDRVNVMQREAFNSRSSTLLSFPSNRSNESSQHVFAKISMTAFFKPP